MIKRELNKNYHYLYPSTLFTHEEGFRVVTVLGSCIAVCLYDTHKMVGGINHYMLPLWNGNGLATPKFGNVAIEKLIQRMELMNCRRDTMIAKVFGGANQSQGVINIGGRNTQVAFDMLEEAGIRIVAKSVGGSVGRKIILNTGTGEVLMKYVGDKK
ncbi:MAG: chemotaxis protein CheD [Flavobacteriales bacterium]|nr:chemotaxis protein CheD [Flavobacteriales bacterium]